MFENFETVWIGVNIWRKCPSQREIKNAVVFEDSTVDNNDSDEEFCECKPRQFG